MYNFDRENQVERDFRVTDMVICCPPIEIVAHENRKNGLLDERVTRIENSNAKCNDRNGER
jgi:hypothetical protein